ncbi:hypothetical protein EZ428_16245 [Pedobacter frigiditerrae]|uniref:Uncharacterized protein n=1 Tax=Pedobacter frigiditerrae TaxID=2530452 RepID=A0A4V2MI71_9SPHI|nr:hypothetical protein [Pedobacter frigiditerrae]TCC89246.1 hypothetical protein EZ428_16245 [Pedobacter frigiditerrae]
MKKLIFLLLLFPTIVLAQLRPGRYTIKLDANSKVMQFNATWNLILANGCENFSCTEQIFDVIAVPGMPKYFTIKNLKSNKYLTFSELQGTLSGISPAVKLEPLMAGTNKRFQQFYITTDKDVYYTIQPKVLTSRNEVFLGTQFRDVNTGGTAVLFDYKNRDYNPVEYDKTTNIIWVFTPVPLGTVSRTPVATPMVADRTLRSEPVIVAPPSANKIDIDFKTGADNLEMKPFQENVEIRILIRNKADAILLNSNKDQNWPNNSIKRVTVPLPADITVDDLREIHVYRNRKNGGTPTTTIFNIAEKDNWNVNKISATAKIKENGMLKTHRFNDFVSSEGITRPLFRFVYEGGDGSSEGQVFKGVLSSISASNPATPTPRTAVVNPIVKIETLTGGDDLRGGNDNLNILIRLKIRPVRNIALNNINAGRNWRNFTEKTTIKTITAAPFNFDDIEDIVLRHTGGGGIGADNWYLDKLKITLTIGGETRVLVDQVAAPIHYFTGDSRSKTFQIIR